MPNVERAITTDAGPQLFRVCQRWRIGPTSARAGIQGFNSDFFGLIYNDVQNGVRIFSELERNQFKVNLALFDRFNKEKLSALNELDKRRKNQVGVRSVQVFP